MPKSEQLTGKQIMARYFAKIGRKGGKIGGSKGGKTSSANMTPAQRKARALKAVRAREAKRKA